MNTHLPVIADQAMGLGQIIGCNCFSSYCCENEDNLIEIHPRPDEALCDGPQALTPPELSDLGKSKFNG